VLEVDGQTVYLEASNGVEMQFSASELEVDAPAPAGAPASVGARVGPAARAGAPVRAGTPSAPPDPKHQQLLALMPESVLGLAAVRFARDPSTQRSGWANAAPLEKLQWVSRVTGLSIEALAALARDGKARQIEAHTAVATSRRAGR
jgi:hypothetical protein